ncbi:substrate binding domain-containing protein [Parasphingopyxis lamellibrachiae]|nr:substrate binding domain-containing protein [Parasphingopyxis lamellibrachiae]
MLLFYRTTRNIAATEAATLLATQVEEPLEALRSIRSRAADAGDEVSGKLRISASHSFGIKCLGPHLADFSDTYPGITLDITLNDRIVDIVGERFDLAIRHGPLPDSSLIAKPILQTRYFACASPEWLQRNGRPEAVEEISKLDCLIFPLPGFSSVWRFRSSTGKETEVPISSTMSANSGLILREYALHGKGIVLLSDWLIGEDLSTGRLIDLFPDMLATPTNYQTAISAVYPNRKHMPKKVSAFISFIRSRLSAKEPVAAGSES